MPRPTRKRKRHLRSINPYINTKFKETEANDSSNIEEGPEDEDSFAGVVFSEQEVRVAVGSEEDSVRNEHGGYTQKLDGTTCSTGVCPCDNDAGGGIGLEGASVEFFGDSPVATSIADFMGQRRSNFANMSTPNNNDTESSKHANSSPACNPNSFSFRKRRLFTLRSPALMKVRKDGKTYSRAGNPTQTAADAESRSPSPVGRRLMTIDAIQTLISETESHARECIKTSLRITGEIRRGLGTTLLIICGTCNKKLKIGSDTGKQGMKSLDVNEASIWAGNATGAGYTTMKHIMTTLDVPFLTTKSYMDLEKIFSCNLHDAFTTLLMKNGAEEKRMAVELGQVDSDGIPWTDVIGDGQWSQRSYNQQGRALSASAVLIGIITKCPLFVGIRNKTCYVCSTEPGKVHQCFKNFEGSSSAMECSIIKEGFEKSLEMHGMRYKRYVGDGDSSVFVNIKDVYLDNPNYFTSVQKITCKLHALRAMNRNLLNAEKNSNKNSGYPKEIRDILSERIHKFGSYANYIIQRHIEMRPITNSETLSLDLRALPHHIFGKHHLCSEVMCKDGIIILPEFYKKRESKEPTTKLRAPSTSFFQSKMWTEILDICKRLSDHSSSLIYNMNTNIAESFQSQVNKFCQGRRCNNIMRGSYDRKVHEATFAFMFGPTWYVNFFRECKFDIDPLPLWIGQEAIQARKKQLRAANPRRRRRNFPKIGKNKLPEFFSRSRKPDGNKDYGPHAQKEDLEENEVEFLIAKFLAQKEVHTVEEQWEVHLKTIGQHANPKYVELREGLLTASNMGELMGLRDSTPNVNMIDKLLYPKDISGIPAVKWGLDNEKKARQLYEKEMNVAVADAGLFISLDFTALAASPDGLIGKDGILEIKCPYSERYSLPKSVGSRPRNAYLQKSKTPTDEPGHALKKSAHYYFQVVQQLHVTRRKWCDFVVWTQGPMITNETTGEDHPITPEGHLLCIRINRDDDTERTFELMLKKAETFFYKDLGPEIVDSRLERNMGFRQPEYRLKLIRELKDKKRKSPGMFRACIRSTLSNPNALFLN